MLKPLGTKGTGINYNFFKVNPSILDSIFSVNADSYWDTDTFLINAALDISEVVNTNITESNEALIAGKGVGTGQGNENFYAKDWGVLMCIYHSVPLLDYVISAPYRDWETKLHSIQ